MDNRVTAHIELELAKANDRLAKLEALEKEVPVLSGTSSARLQLSRKITNARSLYDSWVMASNEIASALDRADRLAEADTTDREREHAKDCTECGTDVPERIVGWVRYLKSSKDQVVCHRARCKNAYPTVTAAKWTALQAIDLPEGGVCDQCGTDVLA